MNRALVAGCILAAALVSGGLLMQSGSWREAGAASASASAGPRLFEEVVERLRRNYIDTLSVEQMVRLAATGVVLEVDERYSTLLTPERLKRLKETSTGRYAGIGVEVDIRDGFVTVVAPIAGTPADSAGIKAGDRILSINGKSTYRLTMEEVEQALRGTAGTKVRLVVEGSDSSATLTVTRRNIVYRAVRRANVLPDGVAYVELATFHDGAADDLRRVLDSLLERRGGGRGAQSAVSSLVLDLRENPGGLLEQGVAVADLFLNPGQTIASTRGRSPETNQDFVDREKQRWPTLPIVVLIDSGTASAAEIVAGALKDHERAALVGTRTYGKGSAQSLFPLNDGHALKLTTARWYTPRGHTIERDSTSGGIEPDVELPGGDGAATAGTDPALQRALQLLQGVTSPAELRARIPPVPRKRD